MIVAKVYFQLRYSFGRKKSILLMHSVGIIGGICYAACMYLNSLEILMAARFFVGIGAGACFSIVPMYANEIAPVHVRGGVAACSQLFITIGIFLATVFVLENTLGSVELWGIGAACMLIFSVISIIMLLLPWSVESPKWYISVKGDEAAGIDALKKLYNVDDASDLLEDIKAETEQKTGPKEEWGFGRLFRTPYLKWPVTFVMSLNAAQQFSGINVVFFFAASLYESAGLEGVMISYAALAVSAVNVLATIVSIWLVDRLGRRPLIIFPMVGMIIMMITETSLLLLNPDNLNRVMSYGCIACMVVYVICFAVGPGPIPLFIGSEVLKPEPRASAMALGGVVNLIGTLLVALLFENVILRFLGKLSFLPFIIITLAFVILFWIKLPETKHRTVEDIYRELGVNDTGRTTNNIELVRANFNTSNGLEVIMV